MKNYIKYNFGWLLLLYAAFSFYKATLNISLWSTEERSFFLYLAFFIAFSVSLYVKDFVNEFD